MATLLQQVVVGVLVAACALYSIWRLLTVPLRLRCLAALAPLAAGARWHAALTRRTLARAGGCAGCAPGATPTPAGRARNQTPGAPRH